MQRLMWVWFAKKCCKFRLNFQPKFAVAGIGKLIGAFFIVGKLPGRVLNVDINRMCGACLIVCVDFFA